MSEHADKILKGLVPHRQYLVEYGKRIHTVYPPAQIDPVIFENITVPVSLPVAMMLFGLATAMLLEKMPRDQQPAEETPV